MSKPTFQQKTKLMAKLFDSGCNTEKKLQQLDMESILKIPGITIPDMALIIELQKETKPTSCSRIWEVERMSSQEHKENSIRFIDSGYNEKFRVNDGEKILIHTRNGTTLERECKYIDDYHTQIGSDVFHICEFAELCERNGHTVEPAGKEKAKLAKSKEKER